VTGRLGWLLGGVSVMLLGLAGLVVWGAGRARRFLP
jgi:hypothetical protein